nr:phospholipase/carboxylesterase [Bdellovibrio sp. HM001]
MYKYIPAKEESSAKTPVLVLMHGVGSNEQDLAEFGASLDPRLDVYSLRGPLAMGPHSYGWFHVNFTEQGPVHNREQAEVARQHVVEFLRDLCQKPNVDTERIFLAGFSQGAIMSFSVALTEASLVRAVFGMGGRTLQEMAALSRKSNYSTTPDIFILHGIEDNRLPFFHAQESERVFSNAGFPVQLLTYSAQHEVSEEMRADISRLLKQRL